MKLCSILSNPRSAEVCYLPDSTLLDLSHAFWGSNRQQNELLIQLRLDDVFVGNAPGKRKLQIGLNIEMAGIDW